MRRGIDQCIRMTAGTVIGTGSRYECAVIRRCGVDSTPGGTMTRRTVAAGGKACGIGAVGGDAAAVGIMTSRTCIMRGGISAYQRIGGMTAGTGGGGNLY